MAATTQSSRVGIGKEKNMRAAAYLRVSSKKQVNEGASLDEQRKDILEHCERNNIEPPVWYVDAGISGRKVNRPAFNNLLADIKAGKYDIVITWKLDRISRRPLMGYKLKEVMDATRTEFYSIIEGNTVNNRVMFGIWLSWAEQESFDKSVRARMGAKARAQRGEVPNTVRYGYRRGEDGRPEIIEQEEQIVRRIFKQYVEGVPTSQIAQRLDTDGIPTRTRKHTGWLPRDVTRIIQATEYIGHGFYGKRRYEQGEGDTKRTFATDSEGWIKIDYPTIIDKLLWEAANELRKVKTPEIVSNAQKVEFALRGLIWCSCGKRYIPNTVRAPYKARRKNGKMYIKERSRPGRMYVCVIGRYKGASGQCVRRTVGAIGLEAFVWEKVKAVVKNPLVIKEALNISREEHSRTGTLDEIESNRKSLEGVNEERQRLLTGHQKGWYTDEDMDIRMKSINERREMYESELNRLESQVADYEAHMANIERFITQAKELAPTIDDWSQEEQTAMIQAFVKRITLKGNTGDLERDVEVRGHLDAYLTKDVVAATEWHDLHPAI